MGWRYRKSINVGGGIRINISNSGVGFSYGVPGFRQSVMPNGRLRTTYSIPGTGVSYVEEHKAGCQGAEKEQEGVYSEFNTSVEGKESADAYRELVSACNQWLEKEYLYLKLMSFTGIFAGIWLLLSVFGSFEAWKGILLAVGLIGYLGHQYYLLTKNKVVIEYSLPEDNKEYLAIKKLSEQLSASQKLQHLYGKTDGVRRRTNAGASTNLSTKDIRVRQEAPRMIETNIKCYHLDMQRNDLYFLPDVMIFIEKRKMYIIDYEDVSIKYGIQDIIDQGKIAGDAEIIGYRWLYSNNDGSPDRRFSNNRQIPVCRNGQMTILLPNGATLHLIGSNKLAIKNASEIIKELTYPKFDMSSSSDEETATVSQQKKSADPRERALKRAKSYVNNGTFSRLNLVEQLKFNGFSEKDSVYAADECGANWGEQAAKAALHYLENETFSCMGLICRLENDKFTKEEAIYAVDYCGANWREQAKKAAMAYLSEKQLSHKELIKKLIDMQFTKSEAVCAADLLVGNTENETFAHVNKALIPLYVELIAKCKNKEICFRKSNNSEDRDAFTCVPMFVGRNYKIGADDSVLVVGRAVNGWDVEWPADTHEMVHQLMNHSFDLDSIRDLPEQDGYYFSRSRFFLVIKEMMKQFGADENDWSSRFAWSNLYKVAPAVDGNPNGKIQHIQREIAIQILKKEIDVLRPRYVVFVTGYDFTTWSWYNNATENTFKKEFDLQPTDDYGRYVEGYAIYNESKIVVACRPEMKSVAEWVGGVLNAFDKIDW